MTKNIAFILYLSEKAQYNYNYRIICSLYDWF